MIQYLVVRLEFSGEKKRKKSKKKSKLYISVSQCVDHESRNAIEIYVNGMHCCHVVRTMTYRRQENTKYLFFFHCYHGFQIEVNRSFILNSFRKTLFRTNVLNVLFSFFIVLLYHCSLNGDMWNK